ncbi:DUF1624 domain-containing protein [Acinetobacter qingfengensis]|uniref:Heparan-alpha-glucosaminide N-acetyltransferase catalytic domain-containing protein n=1 Tax=Acinetobacter qingfengensis TaxID=1262585 RepID=A0A1E7RC01_9GAMM|nr:heparan-alpha-glucosaminide N-acetyltransferase domain-containing protein [Acinetobacter qingfengensis]KAA8734842.1 DUF1624 domain-containing protein [Acinetobacter qingfengensis]OEY96884.1 hypothetical protein BJI46_11895 [Acinetobacter qingfengensis]
MQNPLSTRLLAIDALRGLVIIIMLLDHVRETFYLHYQVPDPMQIESTDPALFFSRSLAHLCAPVFVLLTGISAYLYQSKVQSLKMTREFLIKRGLFLIFLELVIINFAWTGQFPPEIVYLQVIWAIGISMLALAALIHLPILWIWIISVLIIAFHNVFDQLYPNSAFLQALWNILHQRGWIEFSEHFKVRTSYPVLPWIGVIGFGYALGKTVFSRPDNFAVKMQFLYRVGLGCIGLFLILRMLNLYGDQPREVFSNFSLTLMSFFNLTKYPPSLDFILWNCGLGLILLYALQRVENRSWIKPLVIFGSVPMFFYIVHLFVLKLLYVFAVFIFGINHGSYFGVDHVSTLWWISLILCLALYPLMLSFSRFKHQNKHIAILKYL